MININEELSLKIANAISPCRKRSERFVGLVPYSLSFEIREYSGTSQKPEKINVLDKTIVKLIGKGLNDIDSIYKKLGFDISYDLDRNILSYNIEYLKSQLRLIEGGNKKLSLTDKGKIVYERGEYVRTINNDFEIYVIPQYSYFPFLKECLEGHPGITKSKNTDKGGNLSLEQIKFIAEEQCAHVQHTEGNLSLIDAQLNSRVNAQLSVYICFMQNITDNTVRTIIYDEQTDSVIQHLSLLFDGNENLRDSLLKQCLDNEVKEESAEKVESPDKPIEQIKAEEAIISEIEEKGEDVSEGEIIDKRVGSIFDSAEFEQELHDIFEKRENDEIWLISPWIKKYAFLRSREPMIRKFLSQGGKVFIGYSEPEKYGEEMVDHASMSVVKKLDEQYDGFYYAELPKFHYKNVIEYKDKKTTLYTGSFNVLSFCIDNSTEHYRMEQMMLANNESALRTRADYLKFFSKQYIERYVIKMDSMKEGSTLNVPKLNYLKACNVLDDYVQLLNDKSKEKKVDINYMTISDMTREQFAEMANNVLSLPYQKDKDRIQAILSACLFLYDDAKKNENTKVKEQIEFKLFSLLQIHSIYSLCRFGLRKGYDDERKSVVRIICNNINYEFYDIALPKPIFSIINRHKEVFDFKKEKVIPAIPNIKRLLYNSAQDQINEEWIGE